MGAALPMTCEEYYAAARAMGLRPSSVRGVWLDREGHTRALPDPEDLSPENRRRTIEDVRDYYGL